MIVLTKDALREIRHSFGRFMSMLLIIALGCGFFAGLKATKPDMILTASEYFKETNLMDLRLRSSIGVKSQDIAAVRSADGVKGACAGYTADLYYSYDNQNVVLKAFSINSNVDKDSLNNINQLTLTEGRMPEAKNECVVEKKMTSPDTFEVGQTITVSSPSEEDDLSDTLSCVTFEIVGIVISPMYIGLERDSTTVGSGTVNSNIFLPEETFTCDYYTDLYVTLDGIDSLDPFSDEYQDEVESVGQSAIDAFEESVSERYQKAVDDAQSDIDSAQSEASLMEEVLSCSDDELSALYQQASADYDDLEQRYETMDSDIGAKRSLVYAKLLQAKEKLEMLSLLIADETGQQREQLNEQLVEAKEEIEQAQQELDSAAELKTYITDRFDSSDYSGYSGDADKINNVSKVFPAFFVLIAALVCITALTRMVEEQRTLIGTYKALGYSSAQILIKYLLYSFVAATVGSCVGSALGIQIFPRIIINVYKMMYNLPDAKTPFKLDYMLLSLAVSVALTTAAVVFTCAKELKTQPSEIMRPKPPKSGKRVLLERVTPVWNRLSFLMKVTIRNLFRYKKRFIMTLVGVSGCTALIITGFGIKYSVSEIVDMQYGEVFKYSAVASLNTDKEEPWLALEECDSVESCLPAVSTSVYAGEDGYQTTVIAPDGDVSEFMLLEDTGGNLLSLDDGVIITQKLADLCSLEAGDEIELVDGNDDSYTAVISGVMKNYANHYIFMSIDEYERIFDTDAKINFAMFITLDSTNDDAVKEELINDERILGVSFIEDSTSGFVNSIESMDTIVLLLIICAALLALTVLYNLADINITERRRELATIKVLGFYDGETSQYIYRENIISTLIGILIGLLLGFFLHKYVIFTVEIEQIMFIRELVWWAYLAGAAMTIAFALLVNIILHFKLKKIDMAQSLKSVE
ncbi:MAG: FtsX-like permease family protein [Ruminococcus sp.]|nr:FtsX-like permease family protein [Ruminococcus sp.]